VSRSGDGICTSDRGSGITRLAGWDLLRKDEPAGESQLKHPGMGSLVTVGYGHFGADAGLFLLITLEQLLTQTSELAVAAVCSQFLDFTQPVMKSKVGGENTITNLAFFLPLKIGGELFTSSLGSTYQ